MLYLDYAKPLADGKYILSFFADSAADLESISHGQKFVTKNGTDYGVPQAGSTVIVTSPNSGKTTYVMDAEGVWVVTEDISYSAVVANPSDAATAKLEKLKVNNTTYGNWTENEIKALASEGGGRGKLYRHNLTCRDITSSEDVYISTYSTKQEMFTVAYISANTTCLNGTISTVVDTNGDGKFDRRILQISMEPASSEADFTITSAGISPVARSLKFLSDEVIEL